MEVQSQSSVIELMQARKSVRAFDPQRMILKDDLYKILSAATTAPSAWNLQHWRFLVVQDVEQKKRIAPIAWNQKQVHECSALIIVLGDKEAYIKADQIFSEQVKRGYMPEELKDSYLRILPSTYGDNPQFAAHDAIRNASLAAMQLMLAAASLGIDSCPMIGFKQEELRTECKIPEQYEIVLMIALGYGIKPAYPTIRLPLQEVIITESF